MTTLASKLSRLRAQAGATPSSADSTPDRSALRRRLAQLRPTRVDAPKAKPTGLRLDPAALAHALHGEVVSDGLIRIDAGVPLRGWLGTASVSGLRETPSLPGETAPPPALYLDTETTGLAGGSGTLAFLVGVARIQDDAVHLTQWLITCFEAERALMQAVVAHLRPDYRLATYNGKCYDVPLLNTRLRLQHIDSPLPSMQHLDLLPPVRRLFGRRWPDCRLITLERELLGFHREDDLPGAEAPEAWFTYLRSGGSAAALIKVVEHNRQDVLSLAVAHRAIAEAVCAPDTTTVDPLGLARWLAESSEPDALQWLDRCSGRDLCDDGIRLHARLLRRAGRWDEAVRLWERLAERGCADSLERLAIYHEHVSGDLQTAYELCARLPASDAVAHRRARVEAKLRQAGGVGQFTLSEVC